MTGGSGGRPAHTGADETGRETEDGEQQVKLSPRGTRPGWSFAVGMVLGIGLLAVALAVADWANGMRGVG